MKSKFVSTKIILVVTGALLLTFCSRNTGKYKWVVLEKKEQISTNGLIPNSYLINSSVEGHGDTLYYWDSSVHKLILVNSKFEYIGSLSDGQGTGPEQLQFHSGHSQIDSLFFIFGYKALVYNSRTLEFITSFKLPDVDIHWIVKFGSTYALGVYSYEENEYSVMSASFSIEKGLYNYENRVTIPFEKNLDELSKITIPEIIGDRLFVLKQDIGELVILDKDFRLVRDAPLPYSLSREVNWERYEDGTMDINTIEAWDMSRFGDELVVLRSLDLTNKTPRSDSTFMKTLHFINTNGELTKIAHLKEKANHISLIGNYVYAIDPRNEVYIKYEIIH